MGRLIGVAFCAASLVAHAQGEWPDCEVVAIGDGGPAILIDGQVHAPIFFAANNQFGRDEILLEELELARDAGIELYSFNVPLHGDHERAAQIIEKFTAIHPNGYFYVRIWLGADQQWIAQHPDKRMVRDDGTAGVWASPFSETWQDHTVDALRSRINHILEGPSGDHFIGVLLSYLQTGEWFYPETDSFWDYSPASRDAFRGWLWEKYEWGWRLGNAWGDSDIEFDSVAIPSAADRSTAYWGPFRHPNRQRAAIDYSRFLSEGMADVLSVMAQAVKDESRGRSLAGVFYGYTHELNHNGPRALAHSGHLALNHALNDPNIDLIHAPYSYRDRAPGQPGLLHVPAASIAEHGKLLIVEDDTYTHMASPPPDGVIAPGAASGAKDEEETRAVAWRNFANAFAQGAGIWRFDLLSDGRWNDRSVWSDLGTLRRIAAESRSATGLHPEIAVVVDEESVALVQSNTHPYLLEGLGNARSDWARVGATVGYYLASDIGALPDSVKVIALPNSFALDDFGALYDFADAGGMVIIMHATGIYGERGPDVDRLAELTGMEITAEFDDAPVVIKTVGETEPWPIARDGWNPRFAIRDAGDEGTIIATYSDDTGAAAVRPVGDGFIVYCGVSRIPPDTLSTLIDTAGVHRYTRGSATVAVVGRYLFAHSSEGGSQVFEWPAPCIRVERIAPSYPSTVAIGSSAWEDVLPPNRTVIYRCTEGEIDPEDAVMQQLRGIIESRPDLGGAEE